MTISFRRLLSRLTAIALSTAAMPAADAAVSTAAPQEDPELDASLVLDRGELPARDAGITLGRGLALALDEMRPIAATHLAATWALSDDPVRRARDRARARVGVPAGRRRHGARPPVARRRSGGPRRGRARGVGAARRAPRRPRRHPRAPRRTTRIPSVPRRRRDASVHALVVKRRGAGDPRQGIPRRPPAADRRRRARPTTSSTRRCATSACRCSKATSSSASSSGSSSASRKPRAASRSSSARRAKEYGTKTITPEQAFVAICQDELIKMMGPVDTELKWAKKGPTGIMMCGLQGSGKTTTVGKLARWLEKTHKKKPMLVAADIYRPAAVEQLKTLGRQLDMPVFSMRRQGPGHDLPRGRHRAPRKHGCDVIIFDTAGRLAIDEPLMQELEDIDKAVDAREHLPRPRRDDRPGRGERRRHVQQAAQPRRRDHDEARRRRPRWRGAVGQGDHRQADQVPRHGRVSSTSSRSSGPRASRRASSGWATSSAWSRTSSRSSTRRRRKKTPSACSRASSTCRTSSSRSG